MQRAWGAFAEVTTGLGCAFVYFWSLEARAAWPAELSPRCYGERALEWVITTIFPRIYARTYYAHPRARVMSFSFDTIVYVYYSYRDGAVAEHAHSNRAPKEHDVETLSRWIQASLQSYRSAVTLFCREDQK